MKWLLLTTTARTADRLGSNPGDEFARFGIQKIIRAIDKDPVIELLDKEKTGDWDRKHEFDRAVICGMPMFWSHKEQTCNEIYWWEYIWNSYVAGNKRNILPMGIGHVLLGAPANGAAYMKAVREVTKKSWKVVVREPIYGAPSSWVQSVCPSAFCNLDRQSTRKHRICNLMPKGGHFGVLTDDGKKWDSDQAPAIAQLLFNEGFMFVAHSHQEVTYAKKLGWWDDRIHIFNSAQEYLDLYNDAAFYFGNRMHGAAVCAATGCPTWGVTHDSRTGMVSRLGGKATPTPRITAKEVKRWIDHAYPAKPEPQYTPAHQYTQMTALMRAFAYA
jgi:hypothetical protein